MVANVDLTHNRLLKKMMEFFNRGEIGPIHPITHFTASQIEESMRFMQKGSHIGKVVVSLPETSEIATRTGKDVFKLRDNASYLLVGGLGGLGQAIAVWMAEAGATERKSFVHRQRWCYVDEVNSHLSLQIRWSF